MLSLNHLYDQRHAYFSICKTGVKTSTTSVVNRLLVNRVKTGDSVEVMGFQGTVIFTKSQSNALFFPHRKDLFSWSLDEHLQFSMCTPSLSILAHGGSKLMNCN